jgi:threonine synthase
MVATTASTLVIPDSVLAKEATDILLEYSTELLINHSIRVYLFAAQQGRQQELRFDTELLYVAAAFHDLGLIKHLPKISIIQAAGANPLVRTMRENQGRELVRVSAETRATAIRIGNPASWRKAVAVLQSAGGVCEDVSEEEIALAKSELGAEGIGCEPASAATLAGLKKLVHSGFVNAAETVVLVLTGHMLKDVDYMLQAQAGRISSPIEAEAALVIKKLEKIL